MKTKQFQKLLAEYAERTSNVRALNKKWVSGAYRVSDEISSKIGCIVSLLQSKIDEGQLCKKNEYLMVYNFQPLQIDENAYLCSLDMVVRPTSELNDLETCKGTPLQLVINGTTGEVGNNSYGMVAMGLTSEEEIEANEEEAPIIYGNYKDYIEPKQRDFAKELDILKKAPLTFKKEEIKVEKEILELSPSKSVCFSFRQPGKTIVEKKPIEQNSSPFLLSRELLKQSSAFSEPKSKISPRISSFFDFETASSIFDSSASLDEGTLKQPAKKQRV